MKCCIRNQTISAKCCKIVSKDDSPYDPAYPLIAATYVIIAAKTLGLGTCMVVSVHPLIKSGSKARKFILVF
jgi:hypothetical protein